MKYRPRIYYTEEQKALMWDRPVETATKSGRLCRNKKPPEGGLGLLLTARSGSLMQK